jgi:hypothetical protein
MVLEFWTFRETIILWLRDQEGGAKVQVALTCRGLPSFTLADQRGRDRAVLALKPGRGANLNIRNPAGKDRVALWRDQKSEDLILTDETEIHRRFKFPGKGEIIA